MSALKNAELVAVVAHFARHCWRGGIWDRTSKGPRHLKRSLTMGDLDKHIDGHPRVGLAPIVPGTAETKIAVLDFDDHAKKLKWSELIAYVKPVYDWLRSEGYEPIPVRSSSGHGVHLILLFEKPQDAFSVREMLGRALAAGGLKDGTGGVKAGEAERFPKQNEVAADGAGSMFWLPFSGESLLLDAETLEPVGLEEVEARGEGWPYSKPVPKLERPAKDERPRAEASADLAKVRSAVAAIPDKVISSWRYDDYRDVIFAIHHASDGSDGGLEIANELSRRSDKHVEGFIEEKIWPYVNNDRAGNVITAASLFHRARQHGWQEDVVSQFEDLGPLPAEESKTAESKSEAPAAQSIILFDTSITRLGDVFSTEPAEPQFVVYPILPDGTAGSENAIGGAGKTTRHQYEAIHIILARLLYGYSVRRPGAVIFATREDTAAIARYRMHHLMRAMGLTDAEARRVAEHYHIVDLVGTGERLVTTDRAGNLVRTKLAERICRSFEREGVSLVEFDPINLFGPGEKHVNDGEAAVLDVGHAISRELGCAVRFTSHVSKVVGREGIVDAHSGRGGSALGDNARFVWNYLAHEKEHKEHRPPASALEADARGALYRLHISKLSWAQRPRGPIWLERDGWRFMVHQGAPESAQERLQGDAERVATFLEFEAERGVKHSRRSLEDARTRIEGKPSKERLRDILGELERSGRVAETELPEGERWGARKTYLAVHPAGLEAE